MSGDNIPKALNPATITGYQLQNIDAHNRDMAVATAAAISALKKDNVNGIKIAILQDFISVSGNDKIVTMTENISGRTSDGSTIKIEIELSGDRDPAKNSFRGDAVAITIEGNGKYAAVIGTIENGLLVKEKYSQYRQNAELLTEATAVFDKIGHGLTSAVPLNSKNLGK